MDTSCPRCGSHVDPVTDICEVCSWSAPYRVRPTLSPGRAVSFSEQYGTLHDRDREGSVAMVRDRMAPGRVFVVLAIFTVASMLAIVVLGSGSL